mmetsp:Transcript_2942/g.11926  ORF Transcript_2942/g.11926 Transcript_2942/m.11926 type:complete len:375 (+) Transcript_2942:25-1149(+)
MPVASGVGLLASIGKASITLSKLDLRSVGCSTPSHALPKDRSRACWACLPESQVGRVCLQHGPELARVLGLRLLDVRLLLALSTCQGDVPHAVLPLVGVVWSDERIALSQRKRNLLLAFLQSTDEVRGEHEAGHPDAERDDQLDDHQRKGELVRNRRGVSPRVGTVLHRQEVRNRGRHGAVRGLLVWILAVVRIGHPDKVRGRVVPAVDARTVRHVRVEVIPRRYAARRRDALPLNRRRGSRLPHVDQAALCEVQRRHPENRIRHGVVRVTSSVRGQVVLATLEGPGLLSVHEVLEQVAQLPGAGQRFGAPGPVVAVQGGIVHRKLHRVQCAVAVSATRLDERLVRADRVVEEPLEPLHQRIAPAPDLVPVGSR